MSEVDKKLQVINDGKMAELAAHQMQGLISEMKARQMASLSASFRQKQIDQATLVSCVAGFCALEDLENLIKQRVNKGRIASQELYREQTKND